MSAPLTVVIGNATVVIQPPYVETRFPDGSICRAFPEDTPEYRRMARDLGYRDDVGALCIGHELSHSILAEACGDPHSAVLWAVAHGEPETSEHWREEDEVMALQRYANGGPRPDGNLDWDAMRDRLIEVTR